jgi:anti-sigma factor RsiW
MGRIIHMAGDEHHETQALLPWYVNGRLEAAELQAVEDHLADCAECRADLRVQRRLQAEIAQLPMNVENGWADMRRRLAAEAPDAALPTPQARPVGQVAATPQRRGWLGWAVAAAAGLPLAILGSQSLIGGAAASYHALSAPPQAALPGNVVVMFRPDTREAELREALTANGARLVDGPTAAGGYVLRVPDASRPAVLTALRARQDVVLAEPIDTRVAP